MTEPKKNNPGIFAEIKFPKRLGLPVLLIFILTIGAYSPVKKSDFVNYDDPEYVYQNNHIQQLTIKNTKELFADPKATLYVPLVFLSFSIENHFFKLNPEVFHITNLLLHLINCLLVFWLIWLLTKNELITVIVFSLFALHPLHVESVAWITERKDVLYSVFYLSALISYHFYYQNKNRKYYVLTFLFFVLSCFSKVMAVTLPAILLLYDYFYCNQKTWRIIINKIPLFIVSLIFAFVAVRMMNMEGKGPVNINYNMFDKLCAASYGLFFYLQKALLPINLSVIYPYPEKAGNVLPAIYLISPLIILFVFWLVFLYKKSNAIIKGLFLFFLISILPVLQIVPNTFTIAADRYFYLPSLGLFGIAAYYLNKITEQKRSGSATVLILISSLAIVFSVLTFNRCKVWENSITLFTDVTKKYESDVAYANLGLAYNDKNDFNAALPLLQKSVQLNSRNPKVLNNYGWALSMTKQYDQAILEFTASVAIDPKEAKTFNNLANTYGTIGNYNAAINSFEKALSLEPDNATTLYNIAYTYLNVGNKQQALNYYQRSAQLGFKPAQDFLAKNGLSW
ncbi:MAG: tetratricopeptide repeat protein [Bacteroidia bacterium]